jgi:hypothetical protein
MHALDFWAEVEVRHTLNICMTLALCLETFGQEYKGYESSLLVRGESEH